MASQDSKIQNTPHSEARRKKFQMVRSAGLMGIATLASRILGMVRDMICASLYGTTWQWDGFIYAFTIPNFFRRLVAEGAVASAFIPVYSQILTQKGEEAARHFANAVFSLTAVFFLGALLILEVGLSLLLDFGVLSPTLHLTVDLLRYFFPYLCIISLTAIGMGVLNSHKRFMVASLGPIFLNLFWIAGALWIVPLFHADVHVQLRWLASIILFSAMVQLALQAMALRQMGFKHQWIWEMFSSEIQKSMRLFLPAIFGFAIVPLNVLVDMTIGLMIGEGANSTLWYANRLMQFPLAIFAIAMGTALLPSLAGQVAGNRMKEAEHTMRFSLIAVFLAVIPCTVGLIMLRQPIVELLFERGQFGAASTARTSAVLLCYTLGLFAYSGHKIVTSGFYAMHDTKTPVRTSFLCLFLNIFLNLILMKPFKEAGLALATSIASSIQFFILIYYLQKSGLALHLKEIFRTSIKILVASLLMGVVCVLSHRTLPNFFPDHPTASAFVRLFGAIGIGVLIYPVFCFFLRVHEIKAALEMFLNKLSGKTSTPISVPNELL